MYSVFPSLIDRRIAGSDWKGRRLLTAPASARTPSSSGAVDAPVHSSMRKSLPASCSARACSASAPGTALG
ncbi:Uncharacterised protein [Mycobacteroides abscessus subsp. abscessus]|nr:Uncharacterised protein [Mycobacteroides abscessus subsp. abscessus]